MSVRDSRGATGARGMRRDRARTSGWSEDLCCRRVANGKGPVVKESLRASVLGNMRWSIDTK